MPQHVVKVIDGNTLVVENESVPVRVAGIRVPKPGECGADGARSELQAVVASHIVQIYNVRGRADRDTDGSLLREVSVVSGPDVGAWMVSYGWARVDNPPEAYRDQYAAAEQHARKDRLGLWGTCPSR